ncbi:hypothetical protein BDD12DRAFT_868095 [Trichophaea hybrida]|nr:hypothetical protein BDD12DRAFT_868095 [Trichophaea hybrida]
MALLLSTHPDIQITEKIVTTAAGNDYCGNKVMELLMTSDINTKVNASAIKAAAYYGRSSWFRQLSAKFDNASIVNEQYRQYLDVAVEGGDQDIFKLLLDLGGQPPNTDSDTSNWTLPVVAI